MRKFTENQPLFDNIQNNDVKEIKRILIDNIFFLQGNKVEINNAVQYALDKSDFTFDDHEVLEVSDKNSKEGYFSEEKFNLRENYSKERYYLLVELYNEAYANKEYTYETESTADNNKVTKVVAVGVAVAVAIYVLYEILD